MLAVFCPATGKIIYCQPVAIMKINPEQSLRVSKNPGLFLSQMIYEKLFT